MKLTTVVIAAAALAGAAGAAASASAGAIVLEGYIYTANDNPASFWQVKANDTASRLYRCEHRWLRCWCGAARRGCRVGAALVGDCEGCSAGAFSELVTIQIGSTTYSGTFADVLGDIDVNDFSPVGVGTMVPEPATWALMLAGFAGLGAALRMRRKAPIAV